MSALLRKPRFHGIWIASLAILVAFAVSASAASVPEVTKKVLKSRFLNKIAPIPNYKMHYHRRHIEYTFFDGFLAFFKAV